MTTADERPPAPEPPPPILGSWRNLYTAVLVALAVEVVLFYAFTRMFA
jgi:hypothetical protein